MNSAYFKRFNALPKQIPGAPADSLKLIVVIPCFNEPDCESSIQSLYNNDFPNDLFEIIVVVNHSEAALSDAIQNNLETIDTLNALFSGKPNFHIIKAFDLPKKHAGVGWARKIGMDEACRRFEEINVDGTIICFDADSQCSENYLRSIHEHFSEQQINGASIRFEHPLEGNLAPSNYEAITRYELFLRYYNCGLKSALLPYAFHTVGSSMAVRASAYMKQGGMNRRKAGEDFYFLQKIIQLGNFIEINDCMVIPSSRSSDRVPFGTGKAIGKYLTEEDDLSLSYDLSTFNSLRSLQLKTMDIYNDDYSSVDQHIKEFIKLNDIDKQFSLLKKNTQDFASFRDRFHQIFDAFTCLKFVHWYRDNVAPCKELLEQSVKYLNGVRIDTPEKDYISILEAYRKLERETPYHESLAVIKILPKK